MLPNPQQRRAGLSVGPVDHVRSVPQQMEHHQGGATFASPFDHLSNPEYAPGFMPPTHLPGGVLFNPHGYWDNEQSFEAELDDRRAAESNPMGALRTHSQGTRMEPKVLIQMHYDFQTIVPIHVAVIGRLQITSDNTHAPLKLYIPLDQLQRSANDSISSTFPHGVPDDKGYVAHVDRWRFDSFKISDINAVLDGKTCKLPMQMRCETQHFLNDIITSHGKRACLIILDGKAPRPPRVQHVDDKINRDKNLMNLIGAYYDELDLWNSEVSKAEPTRTPWYGGNATEEAAVMVDPTGFIHAATARALGPKKCEDITTYPLHNNKRRLLMKDAAKGIAWLCNNMFRLCPPQRLDQGMLFTVRPLRTWDASYVNMDEQQSSASEEAEKRSTLSISKTGKLVRLDDEVNNDNEVFNMGNRLNVYAGTNAQHIENDQESCDWMEWLKEFTGKTNSTHNLVISATIQMTLRVCIHKPQNQCEPIVYDLT